MRVGIIGSRSASVFQTAFYESSLVKNSNPIIITDRSCVLSQFAKSADLDSFSLNGQSNDEISSELLKVLKDQGIDLLISFYTRLFTDNLLSHYTNVVNFHPAPLPDFPGMNAFARSWAGKREIGSTVHFCDTGIDTGPVIMESRFKITKKMDFNIARHIVFRSQVAQFHSIFDDLDSYT